MEVSTVDNCECWSEDIAEVIDGSSKIRFEEVVDDYMENENENESDDSDSCNNYDDSDNDNVNGGDKYCDTDVDTYSY